MNCPRCKNIGFKPTKDITKPVIVYKCVREANYNLRTLICLQCGNVWETVERWNREIEITGVKVMKMIENAQEILRQAKQKFKHNKNSQQKLFNDKNYLDN